jgi:glycosyltransferase involved in cell wall biosynthesis
MKISIIGPGIMPIPPKGWGAVESLIWDYNIELKNLGHDVQIVNTQNQQEIVNQVNSFNPDFVHLQYDDLYNVMPYINCKHKAATTHYGYLEQPHRYGGYGRVFSAFLQGDFNIICLSEGIKKVYKHYGVNENRLYVVGNGARKDLFRYTDTPTKQDKSVYLAKITDRKRQWLYQNINDIDFVGNKDDNRFNFNRSNYLGEWDKDTLYHNLTDYANLVLLSDGEADPLVTKEALIAGLGVVVSECSTANLDLSKPFINVIPEDKIYDLNFVRGVIETNKQESLKRRNEIREYGIQNFAWENVVQKYMNVVNQIISK